MQKRRYAVHAKNNPCCRKVVGIWFYNWLVKQAKIGLKQVYCYLNAQMAIGFK